MRPMRLEVAGFSAFAEPTVVDFGGVELAAFVGPTGSGKSSVIDAMTFALYGSAARYDQRAVAPVVNQLAAEARVRFDFEVAGTAYAAVRIVRRTKNGATTKEARLESGGDVLAGDEKALTAAVVGLLGLDFDKFNKTVVLPQGKFASFLHDKPADRQELLRGLLGLGVYERIGRAARQREGEATNAAEVLQRQLAGAGDVSDEWLAQLAARAEAIAAQLAVVEEVGAEIDRLDGDAGEAEREVAASRARHEHLVAVRIPDDVGRLRDALSVAVGAQEQARVRLDEARQRRVAAAAAVADGPSEAAMRTAIADHRRHQVAAGDLAAARKRLAAATARHKRTLGPADVARQRLEAASAAAEQARLAWHEMATAQREAGDLVHVQRVLALLDRRRAVEAEADAAVAAAAGAAERRDVAQRAHDEALESLAAAQRLAPAALLAEHLVVGEACPVCAQAVEALPDRHEDSDGHLAAAGAAVRTLHAAASAANDAHRRAEVEVVERRTTLATIDEQVVGEPGRAELEAQAIRLTEMVFSVDAARVAADGAETAQRQLAADAQVAAALAAAQDAADAVVASRGAAEQAESAAAGTAAALIGQPDLPTAEAALATAQRLAAGRADADADERDADEAAQDADAVVAAAATAERRARATFDTVRDALAALADLPPLPPRTESLGEDWRALLAWAEVAAAAVAAAVADGTDSVAALDEQRRARRAELAAALERAATEPIDVAAERRRLGDELVAARAEVRAVERERERLGAVRDEVAAWRERAQVAGLLGNLLRVDGFERWLLEEALADLVSRANVRLRELTGGQYSLVVVDGAFRVVDHHSADEVRDARSLSGGETFLTSLSLALALADSTVDASAGGAAPIESIFLDEGFGTLDPDTLDVVAGTIEELGASGRMVGIITHIRELAERMPTRFEVTKSARTSTIERVDL